ncbi:hypothetical protein UXN85_20670 [Enterobacter hormaechei]
MTEKKRTVFVVPKREVTFGYVPGDLGRCIEEREVIRETPKGMRLAISYSDNGTTFLHSHYDFFETRVQALLHLERETKQVLGEVEKHESDLIQFLRAIEGAVMKEPA